MLTFRSSRSHSRSAALNGIGNQNNKIIYINIAKVQIINIYFTEDLVMSRYKVAGEGILSSGNFSSFKMSHGYQEI